MGDANFASFNGQEFGGFRFGHVTRLPRPV